MGKTVQDIFLESQGSAQNHGKLVKAMIKVYKETEFGQFWSEFVPLLKRALVVFEREPAIERCLEFVAKFATTLKDDENNDKKKEEEDKGEKEEDDDIDEDIHQFLLKLFGFCLQHHNACDKAVRFRVCQLINKLLSKMGEDAQIDDELYDRVYECMLQRMRDIFPIVRIQAVFALARLQDPSDEDCPVINGYLFLLGCDNNSDVRRATLTCIAASTKTLPALLERTRDVKHVVRRLAYQVLAEKVHIRALTIAQRITVLENGLKDREESVREACTTRLLQAWLRTFQGNTLDLLKCLDVENSLKTAELLLTALFKKTPAHELVSNFDLLNEELVMEAENVTCESVLFWRMLCKHLSGLGLEGEEQLEKVLPLPTAFAAYLTRVVAAMKEEQDLDEQLTNEFILHELLELAALLDLSDEAGRKAMGKLIHYLMVSDLTMATVMPTLVGRFEQYQKDPVARINTLCETIADIRECISQVEDPRSEEEKRQIQMKLAQVKVKLNEIRGELEDSVTRQDFAAAAEMKQKVEDLEEQKQKLQGDMEEPISQEVRTEKTDSATLLKCMSIACSMLTSVSFKQIPVTLQVLTETLMLPGVQNEDPAVRNLAVKALGLSCLLSLDLAKKHLVLFITMSQLDVDQVKTTALQVLFDLLLTFGFDTLDAAANPNEQEEKSEAEQIDDEDEENQSDSDDDDTGLKTKKKNGAEKGKARTQSLIFILTELLNSKVSELRTVAAEGLAKLLLAGRIVAPKLVSRLLLLWYNPLTEDDTLLRHCLGTFFPVYAFASQSNQSVVEEAILPTLRTLLNAPTSSPLAEIDVNNVMDLLLQLTNARHLLTKSNLETTSHDTLALKICNEVLSELQVEDSCSIRPLCRAFAALEISDSFSDLKDLSVLTEQILEKVSDRHSKKTVQKFMDKIDVMLGKKSTIDDSVFGSVSGSPRSQAKSSPPRSASPSSTIASADTHVTDFTTAPTDMSQSTADLPLTQSTTESQLSQSMTDSQQPSITNSQDNTTCATLSAGLDKEETDTEQPPESPSANRTALLPVAQNNTKPESPVPATSTESEAAVKKKPTAKNTPAKKNKRTKSQIKAEAAQEDSSEPENDVHSSSMSLRRSSRTTRSSKASQGDATVHSETESPLRKAVRGSTKREQPKRAKRN